MSKLPAAQALIGSPPVNARTRFILVTAAALAVAALAAEGLFRPGAQAVPTPAARHFLEVEKVYWLGTDRTEMQVKVLAEPQDNWLKVEWTRIDGTKSIAWFNLLQARYIAEKPQK